MSRPSVLLRDAALGYASRGIPACPCTPPPPPPRRPARHRRRTTRASAVGTGCSCRDPSCRQAGEHPLGSLVPHGLKEATTNRARVLAWWTQQPQANIGLATGHRFDVLDVDGPTGARRCEPSPASMRLRLGAAGPDRRWRMALSTWPLPAWATPVPAIWSGWTGGVAAAMSSLHRAAMPPATPTSGSPAAAWTPHSPRCQLPCWSGCNIARPTDPPRSSPSSRWATQPGPRYGQAALAQELARVATAPHGQRNQRLWEATRNLYNLVATGALDHHQVHHGLLQAAERCGLLGDEPRQTHRTLASGRQVGLAHPRPAPDRSRPDPAHASPPPPARTGGERTQEGR